MLVPFFTLKRNCKCVYINHKMYIKYLFRHIIDRMHNRMIKVIIELGVPENHIFSLCENVNLL